jgi:hypothetical protein
VKKSLVVLMAVVMTFAFAAATVAADLSYWAGGDMYFYFDSNQQGLIESQGTFMVDGGNPMVQVTSGNTYAKAWYNTDKWRAGEGSSTFGTVLVDANGKLVDANGNASAVPVYQQTKVKYGNPAQWRFSFGWNKIGDVLDLGFSTKDTGTANIGQVAFTDTFNNFHSDPIFNSYDNPYAIFGVLTLGNVTIKGEYNVAPKDSFLGGNTTSMWNQHDNSFLTATFKLDSGEIHVGYKNSCNGDNAYLAMVGGAWNIGDSNLKVDLWKEGDGGYAKDWGGAGHSANYANDGDDIGAPGAGGTGVQVAFGINKFDATLFYLNPESNGVNGTDYTGNNMFGVGANYKFDKLTVGAKYFKDYTASGLDAWEAFGLYNVGAFDVKFGAKDLGTTDDTSLILGFHAGLW